MKRSILLNIFFLIGCSVFLKEIVDGITTESTNEKLEVVFNEGFIFVLMATSS